MTLVAIETDSLAKHSQTWRLFVATGNITLNNDEDLERKVMNFRFLKNECDFLTSRAHD